MRRVVDATLLPFMPPDLGVLAVAGTGPANAGLERAEAYFRAGNFPLCLDIVEQQLAAHPSDIAGLLLKGNALLELDEPKSAIESLRAATKIAPDDHEAWSQLAIALMTGGF